ncbi:MAG: hypothetical protein ACHQX4_02695 [Gemmatimonadales bacterium]
MRALAALLLLIGVAGCKKKPATPPAGRAPAAQGAQKAPPPGSQKAPPPGASKGAPAGSQKTAAPGTQKAAPTQPGQQKAAAPGTQKAAPPAATPARPGAPGAPAAAAPGQHPAASGAARSDTAAQDTGLHIDYRREVYSYQGGARDPFTSLLTTDEAQISVADLRLVSILYDPRGGRSVAVVRDRNSPRPYRVRRGDTVGRLRVIQIRQYEVVFQVEEFGFERQEVLSLPRVEVH